MKKTSKTSKTNKYIKLSLDSEKTPFAMITMADFTDYLKDSDAGNSYHIGVVELTDAQFKKLPEFSGF